MGSLSVSHVLEHAIAKVHGNQNDPNMKHIILWYMLMTLRYRAKALAYNALSLETGLLWK
jgi:hypothetical protein